MSKLSSRELEEIEEIELDAEVDEKTIKKISEKGILDNVKSIRTKGMSDIKAQKQIYKPSSSK